MRRRAAAVAIAALLVIGAGAWVTRYQYVTSSGRVVRVQRWTGSTSVLTVSGWRPVRANTAEPLPARRGESPLDSAMRANGLDPERP